ncbi:MAG: acyl-CoA mutase large subunit family protein [Candidatus Cloacimonetes bacterium]|nr:acyl-CoA mutase large subunit family protein [Candidatus Cloacimonadota bacterium]
MSEKLDQQNERLLKEFEPHTEEQWREATDKLLKGKPYDKIMLTPTYENITLKPIYTKKDAEKLDFVDELPGNNSNLRNTKHNGYHAKEWNIAQEIQHTLPEEFNKSLLKALNSGQNAINLVLDEATLAGLDPNQANVTQVGKNGVSISNLNDLEITFKDVELDSIDIDIQAYSMALPIASMLVALAKKRDMKLADLKGSIGMDPVSELAKEGSICLSIDQAYTEMYELLKWSAKNLPNIRTISVHTHPYVNSGASATEELSFAFSTAVEYIKKMLDKGLTIDVIAPRIQFHLSIGSNFFMEIAKFRAARLIWSKIITEFGGNENSKKMYIHARTTKFNKTRYDIHANLLRTTTEAFSGIAGGIDSLHVGAFDEIIKDPDEFSARIARNQQLILKEEVHLNHVTDPAGGSWYIESLTAEIVKESWKIFQEIEACGGIFEAVIDNKIQEIIDKTVQKRDDNLSKRKDVKVGINMFANLNDTPSIAVVEEDDSLALQRINLFDYNDNFVDVKLNSENVMGSIISAFRIGASIGNIIEELRDGDEEWLYIEPLKIHRVSEKFEHLRDLVNIYSKTNKTPQVFLANFGSLKEFKARADFSRGFFETGGFEIIDIGSFQDINIGAEESLKSKTEVVVICSTDLKYPDIVPEFVKTLKESKTPPIIVLAGYPKEHIASFKEMGIDYFIHLKANIYQTLNSILEEIGVLK